MTDKEIIKALDCCFVQRDHFECPLKDFGSSVVDCRYELAHHVITLITAQKSQIEDLREALEERVGRTKELEAEVERLNSRVKTEDEVREIMKSQMSSVVREVTAEQFDTAMEIAKTAAIRAFAERLKTYFITSAQTKIDTEIVELIETLVKEMTEATDDGNQ